MLFIHLGYYLAGLSYYVGVLIPVGGLPSEKFFPRLHYLIYILIYRTFQAPILPHIKNTPLTTDRRTMRVSILHRTFTTLVKQKKHAEFRQMENDRRCDHDSLTFEY
jgi:hypothetical protein